MLDDGVRVRRIGSIDFERMLEESVAKGLRELGREFVDDIRRTAEPGVLRQRGYTPGPRGARRGRGSSGHYPPTDRWPIWTGKSRQGFAWRLDRGKASLTIRNRAVDARSQRAYPRYVERRGRPLGKLWQASRRKYIAAFGKAFGRRWRKG